MANVAIIEKYPSNFNYKAIFPFEFDLNALVSTKQDKVLKRDITLNIEEYIADFDYVILVGKEACKFVADIRSVTEYQGYLMEDKYLALMNPSAVRIRPSLKGAHDKAIKDIIKAIEGESAVNLDLDLEGIQDTDRAKEYLQDLLKLITSNKITHLAMDTETTALYPRDGYILGISMSYNETSGVYIDSMCLDDVCVSFLQEICRLATIIFHNAKFDMKMLEYHFGLKFYKWEDTMLQHYDLDENSPHGLKQNALRYTKLGDYDSDLDEFRVTYCKAHGVLKKDFTYDLIPFEIIYKYAAMDTIATITLFKIFNPYIQDNPKLLSVYQHLLKPGTKFLKEIEDVGIPINVELIKKSRIELNGKIAELTKSLYIYDEVKAVEKEKGALFNVNSTQHVAMLLFTNLGLPILKKTATGNPSCDAEVLQELSSQHPVAAVINDIKKLKKIGSTYLDKMLAGVDMDGRLRTNFNIHVTTSGRLSSSGKLNAQQLPKDNKTVKNCIEAKEGFSIISQDLKTAEMYVAAVLSGDKNLQKLFINKQDYHGSMAVQKFNLTCAPNEVKKLHPDLRDAAKTISFEILYKLNYKEPALENFSRLKAWLMEQEDFIKSNGYIYSFFGRKRRVKDAHSPNRQEAMHWVRSGINFLVQSVSSDINLLAAIEMQEWIKENNFQDIMKIFGLVHDSILAEVRDDYIDEYTMKLAELTQKDRGLSIPGCPIGLDLEIGKSYGTVKSV